MHEFLETVGVLFALGSIATVVLIFFLFMRAIGRKEREVIEKYQRGEYNEWLS